MRTLAADGVDDGAAPAAVRPSTTAPSWLVPLVIAAVVAAGGVLRFVQRSPLWPGGRPLGARDRGAVALLDPLRHRDPHVLPRDAAGAGGLPDPLRCPHRVPSVAAGGADPDIGPAAAQPLLVVLPAGGDCAGVAGPVVVASPAARQDRPGGLGGGRRRAAVFSLAPRVSLPGGQNRHAVGG